MSIFTVHLEAPEEAAGSTDVKQLSWIVRVLADRIDAEQWAYDVPIRLKDVNGNRVGYALLSTPEDPSCTS